jgi:D-glycero-D-manno-heptose 1,7-bisphosphate phosphatase
MSKRSAVFVELEGVLVAPLVPGAEVASLTLLPGVGAALARFRVREVPVVLVTDGEAGAREPGLIERLRAVVADAGGALAGGYLRIPGSPPSWRKPRPGLLLAAAKDLALDLPSSWLVGARADDAVAAAQAGCAGAVLVGGAQPPDDDLGIVVATARDLADAPRVMIPRGGGCWHGT